MHSKINKNIKQTMWVPRKQTYDRRSTGSVADLEIIGTENNVSLSNLFYYIFIFFPNDISVSSSYLILLFSRAIAIMNFSFMPLLFYR